MHNILEEWRTAHTKTSIFIARNRLLSSRKKVSACIKKKMNNMASCTHHKCSRINLIYRKTHFMFAIISSAIRINGTTKVQVNEYEVVAAAIVGKNADNFKSSIHFYIPFSVLEKMNGIHFRMTNYRRCHLDNSLHHRSCSCRFYFFSIRYWKSLFVCHELRMITKRFKCTKKMPTKLF